MRALPERMLDELRQWGVPMTLRELARRVNARDADVLAFLVSDERFAQSASAPRKTYYLSGPSPSLIEARAGRGMAGTGRVHRGSQCARILAVLEDGNWHTTRELYDRLGGMILHSRVAELRKKGFVIEGDRIPGETGSDSYRYRLLDGASDAMGRTVEQAEHAAPSPALPLRLPGLEAA